MKVFVIFSPNMLMETKPNQFYKNDFKIKTKLF